MIRSVFYSASLWIALCCSSLAMEPVSVPPTYRITGTVVNSMDETPLSHAHLSATLANRERRRMGSFSSSGIETDTDAQGKFTLTVPSAGAWRLTASSTGFVTQAYQEHDNFSSAIVLTASNPTIDLHFRLPPESAIYGTVIDEAGEAVRDARITLQHRASASPDQKEQAFQTRMTVQTDDRGVYEFANLAPGDYRLFVDTKPWYSQSSQSRGFMPVANASNPPDPSLDVTYQLTWYPGGDDAAQAEVLSLKVADRRTADFHLVPIPAVHLQLSMPTATTGANGERPVPFFPMLERIDTGGVGPGMVSSSITSTGSPGKMDIGGLAPGLYRMRIQGQDRTPQSTVIEIAPGSTRTLDLSSASAAVANITVHLDRDNEEDRPFGVLLRNVETGRNFSSLEANMFMPGNRRGPEARTQQPVTLQVPPGRYEVFLTGRQNTYLTMITAKGAEVKGRQISVQAGEISLVLHTANGYATVAGIATAEGKPVVGAMVLLVPAGLDDPTSFALMGRDQTNTDGSFDLNNIIPGPYIMVAIDHGWDVNWKDPSTLQRYLMQGIPLDLHANANIKQDIPAQSP